MRWSAFGAVLAHVPLVVIMCAAMNPISDPDPIHDDQWSISVPDLVMEEPGPSVAWLGAGAGVVPDPDSSLLVWARPPSPDISLSADLIPDLFRRQPPPPPPPPQVQSPIVDVPRRRRSIRRPTVYRTGRRWRSMSWLRSARSESLPATVEAAPPSERETGVEAAPPPPPPPSIGPGPWFDPPIDFVTLLRAPTSSDAIELALEAVRMAQAARRPMPQWSYRFRLFIVKTALPLIGCVLGHFDGDRDGLGAVWDRPPISNRLDHRPLLQCDDDGHCLVYAKDKTTAAPAASTASADHVLEPLQRVWYGAPTRIKLRVFEQLDGDVAGLPDPIPTSVRNAMSRRVRPSLRCLRRHCAGVDDEFVRRWGESVAYASFKQSSCPGTDAVRRRRVLAFLRRLPPGVEADPLGLGPCLPCAQAAPRGCAHCATHCEPWAALRLAVAGLLLDADYADRFLAPLPDGVRRRPLRHLVEADLCAFVLDERNLRPTLVAPDLPPIQSPCTDADLRALGQYAEAVADIDGRLVTRDSFMERLVPARAIAYCLSSHFAGSLERFRRRYPIVMFDTFHRDCCNKGETCFASTETVGSDRRR